MRRCVLAVALLLAGTPAIDAHAQTPTPQQQALGLFEQSKVAYREGRFQDAIDLLKQAHEIHPEPVLLYNLARAYEGTGDFQAAITAYEQYIKDAPEVADRPAIEQRVAGLRRSVDEKTRLEHERDEAKRSRAKDTAPPAPPAEESVPSAVPWIVAGVGGAALGAGAVLGVLALGKHDDAEAARSQQDAQTSQGSAEDLGLGATIALVAGGAIAGGGIVWGIIDVASSGPAGTPRTPGPSAPAKSGGYRVRLVAAPTFVGLRGVLW